MTHSTTSILGAVLVIWTLAVCVWSLWVMGPARRARVQTPQEPRQSVVASDGDRASKSPRLVVLRGGRP